MPALRNILWKNIQHKLVEIITAASQKANTDLLIDPHSQNTLSWGLKINPQAGVPLKIALLGHDIERAYSDRIEKIKPYDEYKAKHSRHSAEKLDNILKELNADEILREDVFILVSFHDILFINPTNASPALLRDLELLRTSDGISYLDVQFERYLKKEGVIESAKKLKWTYDRLTDIASIPKKAKELYIERKEDLLKRFQTDMVQCLRNKGSFETEERLEESCSTLIKLFSSEDLDPVYQQTIELIEKSKKDIKERFYQE